jgi:hypothetical protein
LHTDIGIIADTPIKCAEVERISSHYEIERRLGRVELRGVATRIAIPDSICLSIA